MRCQRRKSRLEFMLKPNASGIALVQRADLRQIHGA